MRRIVIPLFIIAILLCTLMFPSPGQCCVEHEDTILGYVKDLFSLRIDSHDPEDYPKFICPVGDTCNANVYALGFTISPHETIPDYYWIDLHYMDCIPEWEPYPWCGTGSIRECYSIDLTSEWPGYGTYPPYPGYPIIDPPPNLGVPPGPEEPCAQSGGNPINFGTGNKFQQEVDFSVKTPGPELAFRRFYNSQSTYNGPLGYGWTHNYNLFIEDQGERVIVWDADGKALYFNKQGGGSFTAEPLVYDTLIQEGGGTGDYVLTRTDNTFYRFNPEGRLLSIKDRNDNQLTLTYSGTLLTAVSNTFGRAITFTPYPDNRIETVSDPKGNTYTFTYTGENLTGMAAPDGFSTQYLYEDPHDPHNLTQKKVEGQTVGVWGYDEHDRATYSSKGAGVEAISVTYGGDPNTIEQLEVSVTDSRGNERIYRFWSLYGIPRVRQITGGGCSSCTGIRRAYDYDKDSFALIQVTDRWGAGVVTDFTRDARGNILTKKEASGTDLERTTTYTYHPTYNLVETITVESVANPPEDKVTTFSYNPSNGDLMTKTVRGYIGTTQYEYTTTYGHNSFGQLTMVDGPRTDVNDITTYTYDELTGDLLSMTQPHVGTTSYSGYDQNGNVGTVTDPNGAVTGYTYDERNRVKTITLWLPNLGTRYFYDPLGTIDYVILPEGNMIDYTYDAAGRLRRVEDDLGNAIIHEYDTESNKRREEIRDPEEVITKYLDFEYDGQNRLWKIINPDTTFTELTYEEETKQRSVTDPRLKTTTYQYDDLKRLESVTQPGGMSTTYAYDAHDNLRSVEDANSNPTTYTYDDFGRVTKIISPDTGTTTYRHDEAGNLIEKTDSKNITVTYAYDGLNRLTAIEFPDPSQNITYSYDSPLVSFGKGRLTGMADPTGTYTYHYDFRGNLIKEEKLIAGITYTTEYTYDFNANLESITYPSGRVVTYVLDSVRRVSEVRTTFEGPSKTLASNIKYVPYGGITELTYGNGLVRAHIYDLQYRTESIQTGSVLNLGYTPDPNGNFTSITDYLDPSRSQSFVYDDLNRLESASGIYGQIGYDCDFVGNRNWKTVNGYTDYYFYEPNTNKLDEITGANYMDFDHDPNGNIVTMGSKTFTYNQNNRLIEASVDGETVAEYLYNGLGQRIGVMRPGEVTRVYHYDFQGRLIAETTPGGTTLRQHIYVGDRPLAEEQGGAFGYVHTDHLGTPLKMTSGAGTVVWRADYKPFGEAQVDEDPDGNGIKVTMNLRFPGQYFDKETGLHYNWYRDYHPGIGRYIEPDLIGLKGGINLYTYVYNGPVNWVDPVGLFTWPYTWKGWVGIILTGAGATTLFVPLPGARPAGLGLLALGGTLTIWDIVEGVQESQDFGKDVGKTILKDRIKLYGEDPRELQKRGMIPPNERLKELGFTDKDLKELGLLREDEQCK